MRSSTRCLLAPALLLAGVAVMSASQAEARVWVRRPVGRVVVAPAPVYVHPYRHAATYWYPGVSVAAPGVYVGVGPGAVYAPPYYVPAPVPVVVPMLRPVIVPRVGVWW
jgi:hypothetical protein